MAAKILLTPDELKAQAAEMDALRAEYESLFANVSGELRKANSNWSTNMAGNFAGKINSATKSFRNINDLLENGANAAKSCAVSFESIDSELSKLCKGETSFADDMKNAISATGSDLKASVEDVNKVMEYIDEKFDLGSVRSDNGILVGTHIDPSTEEDDLITKEQRIAYLNNSFPDGSDDGKIITIGTAKENKEFYAYNYGVNPGTWYYLGTIGTSSESIIGVSTQDSNGNPTDVNINSLPADGLWFVIES